MRECGVGISDTLATRGKVLTDQITTSDYIYMGEYKNDGTPKDSYYGANARLFKTVGEGAWGSNKAKTIGVFLYSNN